MISPDCLIIDKMKTYINKDKYPFY